MKRYLFIVLLVPFWGCEDKVPADDTLHTFELHSNNRVSSLLMTDSEYSNWVTNDGFTDASLRLDLINDIYKI